MRAAEPDRPVPRTDIAPGLLLARLGAGAMRLYRSSLKATGLKPAHVAALVELRERPVGQQALAEATGVEPVKLVGVLNDLETAGFIERRRDCTDRRRHIVAITCGGRERLKAVDVASATAEDRLLAGLDRAQREQLAALLQLIVSASGLAEPCPGIREAEPPLGDADDDAELLA